MGRGAIATNENPPPESGQKDKWLIKWLLSRLWDVIEDQDAVNLVIEGVRGSGSHFSLCLTTRPSFPSQAQKSGCYQ